MVAYSPLRDHKNFFRLALTCHPDMEESHIEDMMKAIEECGESVTVDMIWLVPYVVFCLYRV